MNTKILQNCVDELKKTKPKKEYVIGMLETLIAMSGNIPVTPFIGGSQVIQQFTPQEYPSINDTNTPVITGFKDLYPKEETTDAEKTTESAYLGGGIGRI